MFGTGGGPGTGDTTAPSTPTGLTVSGTTSSSVSLSWTASTDNVAVTGYLIYRNGTQVGTSTATTYTDTSLTASTQYSYTVRARDAANNQSAASAAVNATTQSGGTGTGSLTGTYHIDSDWGSGFVATVTIKNNGTAAVTTWRAAWTYGGSQKITNAWNATVTQSGTGVTATPVNWNASIPAGASVSFGFQGTYSGSNTAPTVTVS
nr:cellulose binding domain-containing protein [Actinoplanes globisporus]